MWKNGEIVTVCGKKYIVKSAPHAYLFRMWLLGTSNAACNLCSLCRDTDANCNAICFSEENKLNGDQYLEEL